MPVETVDFDSLFPSSVPEKRNPSDQLGKDDFLLLLTTQLNNQDPMSPMEDMEFIGQMSQFSSLEQMLNMNKTLETFTSSYQANSRTQAMMYLGTTVTAQSSDMAESVTGMVEMVGFEDGIPFLKVGDNAFKLEEISLVSPTYINTGSETPEDSETPA